MTLQANIQEQTVLLTVDQLTKVLERNTAGNEQIAGAIKFVGGMVSAAVTLYSAASVFQTMMNSRRNQQKKQQTSFSKLDSDRINRLHDWLDTYFDKNELMDVCYEVDVDYEDLDGSGQSHKARELVEFCARRKSLKMLEEMVFTLRPHLKESKISA